MCVRICNYDCIAVIWLVPLAFWTLLYMVARPPAKTANSIHRYLHLGLGTRLVHLCVGGGGGGEADVLVCACVCAVHVYELGCVCAGVCVCAVHVYVLVYVCVLGCAGVCACAGVCVGVLCACWGVCAGVCVCTCMCWCMCWCDSHGWWGGVGDSRRMKEMEDEIYTLKNYKCSLKSKV